MIPLYHSTSTIFLDDILVTNGKVFYRKASHISITNSLNEVANTEKWSC